MDEIYEVAQSIIDSRMSPDKVKGILQVATSYAVKDHRPRGAWVQTTKLRYKVQVALDELSRSRYSTELSLREAAVDRLSDVVKVSGTSERYDHTVCNSKVKVVNLLRLSVQ